MSYRCVVQRHHENKRFTIRIYYVISCILKNETNWKSGINIISFILTNKPPPMMFFVCINLKMIMYILFSNLGVDTKGCHPMFLMRMCLGDIYMTSRSAAGIRRPPCKKCGRQMCTSHQEIYDSVVANFMAREFVVYDRSQSYPEYLIWYQ